MRSGFRKLFITALATFCLISTSRLYATDVSCVNEHDLPNFKKVDDNLYRGGQPTREGFLCLQKLGIKTVINVRHSDKTAELIEDLPFKYHKFTMEAEEPKTTGLVWFLKNATKEDNSPKFLHCAAGSHRTGWLVAMYRVMVDGWDKERAITEMTADDTGFNNRYPGLVEWVRNSDTKEIQSKLSKADGLVLSSES